MITMKEMLAKYPLSASLVEESLKGHISNMQEQMMKEAGITIEDVQFPDESWDTIYDSMMETPIFSDVLITLLDNHGVWIIPRIDEGRWWCEVSDEDHYQKILALKNRADCYNSGIPTALSFLEYKLKQQ